MIVVDASLMVEMLLNRPLGAVVRERLAHCAEPIAIPHIDIEAHYFPRNDTSTFHYCLVSGSCVTRSCILPTAAWLAAIVPECGSSAERE